MMVEDNRQRYPITCPGCGSKLEIGKSIFHEWGMNDLGACVCPECKMAIHCTYVPESDSMSVETYHDWVERRQSDLVKNKESEVGP